MSAISFTFAMSLARGTAAVGVAGRGRFSVYATDGRFLPWRKGIFLGDVRIWEL